MPFLILGSALLDPATLDTLWTLSVSCLLLLGATLTVSLLPWTDAEILATHRAAQRAPSVAFHALSAAVSTAMSTAMSTAVSTTTQRISLGNRADAVPVPAVSKRAA